MVLIDFFSDVGPKLSKEIPKPKYDFKHFLGPPCNNKFTFRKLTPISVLKTLKSMKPKSSFSTDLISNKVLKIIAPIIINPLVHIFNLSLCSGFLHCTLKTGILKPLFKSGTCNQFTNFRPIALLSAFAKLAEKCAINQLALFFDRNKLFYKYQFGFRPNHSTAQAILKFCDIIHSALDSNRLNLTVFIDLKKAFDTVDPEVLLAKLEHYGISGDSEPLVPKLPE